MKAGVGGRHSDPISCFLLLVLVFTVVILYTVGHYQFPCTHNADRGQPLGIPFCQSTCFAECQILEIGVAKFPFHIPK